MTIPFILFGKSLPNCLLRFFHGGGGGRIVTIVIIVIVFGFDSIIVNFRL